MDTFAEGLRPWHDFFMLAGTSAATLMGLVFVAISLGGNMKRTSVGTLHTFVSPIVLQFGYVLILSALIVVPMHRPRTLGIGVGAVALSLLLNLSHVLRGMVVHHRAGRVARAKWTWNFALPFAASLLALAAAGELFLGAVWALDLLAASLAAFLFIGIRNTWMLVLWIVEHSAPPGSA